MSKSLKCAAGVIGIAFILSPIGSSSGLAGTNGPPTRKAFLLELGIG